MGPAWPPGWMKPQGVRSFGPIPARRLSRADHLHQLRRQLHRSFHLLRLPFRSLRRRQRGGDGRNNALAPLAHGQIPLELRTLGHHRIQLRHRIPKYSQVLLVNLVQRSLRLCGKDRLRELLPPRKSVRTCSVARPQPGKRFARRAKLRLYDRDRPISDPFQADRRLDFDGRSLEKPRFPLHLISAIELNRPDRGLRVFILKRFMAPWPCLGIG